MEYGTHCATENMHQRDLTCQEESKHEKKFTFEKCASSELMIPELQDCNELSQPQVEPFEFSYEGNPHIQQSADLIQISNRLNTRCKFIVF